MSKQVGLDTWAKTQIKCPRLRLFHLNDTHLSKEALERITGACPNLQHLVATAVPSLFSAPSRPTEKRIYGGDDDLSRASRLMELTSHGDPAHEEMFRTREHEDKKGKGKLVEEDNEDEGSQQMIPKDLPTAKLECPRMKNLRLSVDPYTPHQPMVPSKLLLRAPDLQILVAEGMPFLFICNASIDRLSQGFRYWTKMFRSYYKSVLTCRTSTCPNAWSSTTWT